VNITRFLLLLILASLLIYTLQFFLDGRLEDYRITEEMMYLPDPEIIRRLSFGHEGLVSDMYWLRTVQYYGGKRRDVIKQNYQLLEPLLRITTALDPEMLLAYRFGAIFLSEPQPVGPGEPEKALAFLDEGIRRNPDAWQLIFDKGFIYFWQLKDYRRAAEWFQRGSEHPGAPEWLGGLAAFALECGGDIETSRYLWTKQYEASSNEKMRANAMAHLRSLRVDEDLWTLEFLLERYQETARRLAASWEDLIRTGLLKSLPVDPSGVPYLLGAGGTKAEFSPASTIKRFKLPEEARERFIRQLQQRFGTTARRVR
jgi:tetratricopeptide (TPR) repeat protein